MTEPLQSRLDYSSLKALLRSDPNSISPSSSDRTFLWSELTSYGPDAGRTVVDKSTAISSRLARLGAWEIVVRGSFEIRVDMDEVDVERIAYLLEENFTELSEMLLIQPLLDILVSAGRPSNVIYSIASDILKSPTWFFRPRVSEHRSRLSTFRLILQRTAPRTFEKLQSLSAIEDSHLNEIFIYFFANILSKQHVERIVELFLLEGGKIQYRFGLALFLQFKSFIKSPAMKSADVFWEMLKSQKESSDFKCMEALAFGKTQSFFKISRQSTLRRTDIVTMESNSLSELGSRAFDAFDFRSPYSVDLKHERRPNRYALLSSLKISRSTILNEDLLETLLSFLPNEIARRKLSVIFSTQSDGWSLQTIYSNTLKMRSLMILIKGISGCVVAGYFSNAEISPPSMNWLGDPSCFVARLDGSHKKCFRPPVNNIISGVVQYVVSTRNHLSFGHSDSLLTSALWLDEDLTKCYSGASDTYKNDTGLVPEEGPSFDIERIEILHFTVL